MQCILNLTYNNAFLGCSCQFVLPHQAEEQQDSQSFQSAPQNHLLDQHLTQQNSYIANCQQQQPTSFVLRGNRTVDSYMKESVLAKLIYTYRQYQNAFEKSSKDLDNLTTPGLIQQSIIPMPQQTHVNEAQQQSGQNWMQYLPVYNPQPDPATQMAQQ